MDAAGAVLHDPFPGRPIVHVGARRGRTLRALQHRPGIGNEGIHRIPEALCRRRIAAEDKMGMGFGKGAATLEQTPTTPSYLPSALNVTMCTGPTLYISNSGW